MQTALSSVTSTGRSSSSSRTGTHAGAKEVAVQERFSLTPTGYHQMLNRLIDNPAAEAHAPRLVRRLRRRRATRQEQRSARRSVSG